METPIIYSGDKVQLGKRTWLTFGFEPLYDLPINESTPVAKEYQKLFDQSMGRK